MAKKQKKNKKWLCLWLWLLLVVAVGVVCYLVWEKYFKVEPRGEEGAETIVIEGGEDTIKSGSDGEDEAVEDKKDDVVQYDGEDPNENSSLTGVVTYAAVSGDNLMIRVNIDQYLNNGECMLLLSTAGNIIYSNVAKVVSSAATATCEGFNVPVSLLESGQYNIVVEIDSGGKSGTIKGEVKI